MWWLCGMMEGDPELRAALSTGHPNLDGDHMPSVKRGTGRLRCRVRLVPVLVFRVDQLRTLSWRARLRIITVVVLLSHGSQHHVRTHPSLRLHSPGPGQSARVGIPATSGAAGRPGDRTPQSRTEAL